MPAENSRKITLTKLQTAERQIDTAIWLWFNNADVVSIISLTGAAAGVLDDLLHDRKIGRLIPFTENVTPPEFTSRDVRDIIRKPQEFAKHARADPDGTHQFECEFAELYLYTAVLAFEELKPGEKGTGLRRLFAFRHWLFWPEHFFPSTLQIPPNGVAIGDLKKVLRAEFLEKFFGLAGKPPSWP